MWPLSARTSNPLFEVIVRRVSGGDRVTVGVMARPQRAAGVVLRFYASRRGLVVLFAIVAVGFVGSLIVGGVWAAVVFSSVTIAATLPSAALAVRFARRRPLERSIGELSSQFGDISRRLRAVERRQTRTDRRARARMAAVSRRQRALAQRIRSHGDALVDRLHEEIELVSDNVEESSGSVTELGEQFAGLEEALGAEIVNLWARMAALSRRQQRFAAQMVSGADDRGDRPGLASDRAAEDAEYVSEATTEPGGHLSGGVAGDSNFDDAWAEIRHHSEMIDRLAVQLAELEKRVKDQPFDTLGEAEVSSKGNP